MAHIKANQVAVNFTLLKTDRHNLRIKAAQLGMTMTEFLVHAINNYQPEVNQND